MPSDPVRVVGCDDPGPSMPVRVINLGDLALEGLESLQVGDVVGGNYVEMTETGILLVGSARAWDDEKAQAFAARLDTSSGRIDYDFTDLGVSFQSNARYPEEPLGIVHQMTHRYAIGTALHVHIHWLQAQAAVPNWMVAYRICNNGVVLPGWTNVAFTGHKFVYPGAGTILQISDAPAISGIGIIGVSAFLDLKIYRDSANASGLFAGADPVGTDATIKEADTHFIVRRPGSRTEYAD